jgi:hypothetical protein
MRVTTYNWSPSFTSEEENNRQRAIAEQTAAEFEVELQALLKKYKAEVSVNENTSGYAPYIEGIDVDFDGIYENGVTVRPYFTIHFNSDMT